MMERDWLSLVGLMISLLLVAAPFWLLPHAGDESTTYAVERIEYGTGLNGGIDASEPIRGLDCYDDDLSRGCLFAQFVADNGPVTVDISGSRPIISHHGPFTSSRYVTTGSGPPFRQRNITIRNRTDDGGQLRARYALEPVVAETVLQNIAVD